jgi:curved DNA-binding protein CbpA
MTQDPFDVLGIPRGSDEATVKTRFKNLAKKHHPDLSGDAIYFGRIKAAYDLLRDQLGASGETKAPSRVWPIIGKTFGRRR